MENKYTDLDLKEVKLRERERVQGERISPEEKKRKEKELQGGMVEQLCVSNLSVVRFDLMLATSASMDRAEQRERKRKRLTE